MLCESYKLHALAFNNRADGADAALNPERAEGGSSKSPQGAFVALPGLDHRPAIFVGQDDAIYAPVKASREIQGITRRREVPMRQIHLPQD